MRNQFLVALVVVALAISACGGTRGEAVERVAESQSGADVKIGDNGDSITIESDDGSAAIDIDEDADGITITGTDDSGQDVTIELGSTEVPDDFPMPIFEPGEVTRVASTTATEGSAHSVTIQINPGDADAALGFYTDWFKEEGMTVSSGGTTVLGEANEALGVVQVTEYGSYSEVVLSWTPNS